jgi:hypothetical protein
MLNPEFEYENRKATNYTEFEAALLDKPGSARNTYALKPNTI